MLVISIDQFRADYLSRFKDLYLPARTGSGVGGFRYLAEEGANYIDAHQAHVPTATGPGHAAILTGCGPNLHGIAGNNWYDRALGRIVYCVEDRNAATVGGSSGPMSPRNLKVSTVGDELEMATNDRAKIVALSFKDRAAILMAGHSADVVIWFDDRGQSWVTSDWYSPAKKLPGWVASLNSRRLPAADMAKTWSPLLKAEQYRRARKAPSAPGADNAPFSHQIAQSIDRWEASPFGQQFVFHTIKQAIESEELGQDDVPDLIAVNLATNDYVGHEFGPNSPEVLDISVQTDRMLSDLFNYLDKTVGLQNTVIALTADHGVVPIPEEANKAFQMRHAARPSPTADAAAIDAALDQAHGQHNWVLADTEGNIYLDRAKAEALKLDLEQFDARAAKAAMTVEGVHYALTRSDLLGGRIPLWDWARLVGRSFNARLSGDLFVVSSPGAYPGSGTGTGHFSPWPYDTHVPLLIAGFGIKRGTHARRAEVIQLAPTLCHLLGVEYPSGNVGEPLHEVLSRP